MAFWNLKSVEPKRNFRYKVVFGGDLGGTNDDNIVLGEAKGAAAAKSQMTIFASKVKKPSFKMTPITYQYLNHKFNYPGRIDWEDVSMTFTDAGGSSGVLDIAKTMMSIFSAAGYVIPDTGDNLLKTISKELANKQLGEIQIEQLNAAGQTIEHWYLYNAFFSDVTFPEMSYETDSISDVNVTVKYDYAKLVVGKTAEGANNLLPSGG